MKTEITFQMNNANNLPNTEVTSFLLKIFFTYLIPQKRSHQYQVLIFLKLECAFYYSLQKITNGEYLEWHDNGQQYVKCTYTDGKLNGEYLSWYENGQQYVKCTYTDGKLNGGYLKWYDNGHQQFINCTYTDGKKNGEYLKW
jgi:antitoxin component YwqK of YwqJK toxin-antitoxin module